MTRTSHIWFVRDRPQEYRYGHPPETRRVIQERDDSNTPTVSYTRGSDLSGSMEGAGGWASQALPVRCPRGECRFAASSGGLLARSHGYSSGNWSTHNFYHADGNGNVTYLVDGS
jgi:hypothetical protein